MCKIIAGVGKECNTHGNAVEFAAAVVGGPLLIAERRVVYNCVCVEV
jgi:hypothetical protein